MGCHKCGKRVQGLGLNKIAEYGAGFQWRDETPGGLNSQIWAEEAIAGSEESCTRVLAYNEDDVRATAVLREWFWKLNSTAGGSST